MPSEFQTCLFVVAVLGLPACAAESDPPRASASTGGSSTGSPHAGAGSGGAQSGSGNSGGSTSMSGGGSEAGGAGGGSSSLPQQGPGCGFEAPAFCDTFDQPAPGGRGGDLDETRWSVARASAKVNPGQGELVSWRPATLSACGTITEGVYGAEGIVSCTNPTTGLPQLTSVFDDVNGPAFESLRVLQPFDFEGRVGRITMDLDAKTRTPEGHGWWWEIVIADEPVPVPYQAFISHALMARRAVVLEFEGVSSFDGTTNELSHVFVEDNYAYAHEFTRDQANYVAFKTEEEVLNHIEILISKDSLEVWATDLDDMSTFRKVAQVDGLGLSFTRGYVNIQHSQYNAEKGGLDGFVTYHLGSLGFDGPALPRPRSYQVPDAMRVGRTSDVRNLGYLLSDGISSCCEEPNAIPSFTLEGVDLTNAVEARLNLNAWYFTAERSIEFRFNGGAWRTFAHPYPDSTSSTRAVTMPVDLADLANGQNTLQMRTADSTEIAIANLELEVVPQ